VEKGAVKVDSYNRLRDLHLDNLVNGSLTNNLVTCLRVSLHSVCVHVCVVVLVMVVCVCVCVWGGGGFLCAACAKD
jgi:hypothetical protein